MYAGEPSGACSAGVCHKVICGNGILEATEVCDDGNLANGDGCSATCDSIEQCGNRVVDATIGEECDDGNFKSHDGCSSRCKVELPTWKELSFDFPAGPIRAQMIYDSARAVLVAFGGLTSAYTPVARNVLLDGTQWILTYTDHRPDPRSEHVVVYDALRRKMVVFGGHGSTLAERFDDTWEYDGRDFTKVASLGPSARSAAAGAYDAARARVILFGGEDSAGDNGETWAYQDGEWTLRTPAHAPASRHSHVMAYDAEREVVVLFGGESALGSYNDTWEWNGDDWTQVVTTATPVARGAMAYDATRKRVVLFGGVNSPLAATWEYDGTDWTDVTPSATPAPRIGMAMAFDAGRDRVVLWGGGNGFGGVQFQDEWEFDGAAWTEVARASVPGRRIYSGFTYDRDRDRTLIYGGMVPGMPSLRDQWAYDGT